MATTKAKEKAAPKKGAAARAEKAKQAKKVKFRGTEFALAPKIPGSLLFDLADIESGRDLAGTMELLKSLLGAGQFQVLRDKVTQEGLDIEETTTALGTLVENILDTYGITEGE